MKTSRLDTFQLSPIYNFIYPKTKNAKKKKKKKKKKIKKKKKKKVQNNFKHPLCVIHLRFVIK